MNTIPVPVSTSENRVSVVVTCHNYGRFLAEAVESVNDQGCAVGEIIIIDDSSTDDTPQVAARCNAKYVRVDYRCPSRSREHGLRMSQFPYIMFLDADNKLAPNYLSTAVERLRDPLVGVVACDLQLFGDDSQLVRLANNFDKRAFALQNCLDTGCVARRDALLQLGSLKPPNMDHRRTAEDWLMFRRVLELAGWKVAANSVPLLYRRHGGGMLQTRKATATSSQRPYYDDAGLGSEVVTVVTTYSGRVAKEPSLWRRRVQWFNEQKWPREQFRVLLINTSHKPLPVGTVEPLLRLKCAGVSTYDHFVGVPNLEGIDRRQDAVEQFVQTACAALYNRMMREATTEWVLILEDDVFPMNCPDLIERLLSSVDNRTYGVSGIYRQRYCGSWSTANVVPGDMPVLHKERGEGVQQVTLAGFGCLMLRRSQVADIPMRGNEVPSKYFDVNFSSWIARFRPELKLKVDWSIECDHVGAKPVEVLRELARDSVKRGLELWPAERHMVP